MAEIEDPGRCRSCFVVLRPCDRLDARNMPVAPSPTSPTRARWVSCLDRDDADRAERRAEFVRANPVSDVCARLADPDREVRRRAANILRDLRDPVAEAPLLRALERESLSRGSAYSPMIDALPPVGGHESVAFLRASLCAPKTWRPLAVHERDMEDVCPATDWLGRSLVELAGVEAYLDVLLELVAGTQPEMQALALGEIGDLASGNSTAIFGTLPRELAAGLLEPLRAALTDDTASVRARAGSALASCGDPDAGSRLIALLDDPDSGVRQSAAHALGRLQDPSAIPFLRRCALRHPECAGAVADAENRITWREHS